MKPQSSKPIATPPRALQSAELKTVVGGADSRTGSGSQNGGGSGGTATYTVGRAYKSVRL